MKDSTIKNLYNTGFCFKKRLGQNFITDTNLLKAIVNDADISAEDTVLEIGTGAGTLTKQLAKAAKSVYTFEIDNSLAPILKQTFCDIDNIYLHFHDILKLSDKEIKSIINTDFKVVANIPYYITTALLMRFIESDLPTSSLTFTVQKEVAKRICAKPNNSDYGALTLACALWGDAEIKRIIKKEVFYPIPKMDSAVIKIKYNPKFSSPNERNKVSKLVKSAFHMRRKTLVNNLSNITGLSKEQLSCILAEHGIIHTARGEELSLNAYLSLAKDNRLWDAN